MYLLEMLYHYLQKIDSRNVLPNVLLNFLLGLFDIHKRIENRLRVMFDNGLEQEVLDLLECYNIPESHPIRKSENYKPYVAGI